MIYDRKQGHNCDTENKPVIGRMQALSSTDNDISWWHNTYLSFWLWLQKYLVTRDPSFGTLILSNFVPWLLTHFSCDNIDVNYSNLDDENILILCAEQTNLKPSINQSLHADSKGDALHADFTSDTRVSSAWRDFG